MSGSAPADWLLDLVGLQTASEGEVLEVDGRLVTVRDGVLRFDQAVTESQEQVADSFGFKWNKRETFESDASLARTRAWLIERYGDVADATWWSEYGDRPLVVDAGCGAGMSGLELLSDRIGKVRYLGADISSAVDVARDRFAERGIEGAGFMQADVADLPLPPSSVDVILSEGVMHHTPSTEATLKSLAIRLAPGGRFMFYVYNKKGPVREFTDDHLRMRLAEMSSQDGWDALIPLTKLGRALGELDATVDVPAPVDLLGIPAGPISVQRLFYWHVVKAFYDPNLDLDEMNHINFDWFAPLHAHRQTPAQVRTWCEDAGLIIDREVIEDAGITIIARKADR